MGRGEGSVGVSGAGNAEVWLLFEPRGLGAAPAKLGGCCASAGGRSCPPLPSPSSEGVSRNEPSLLSTRAVLSATSCWHHLVGCKGLV